MLRTARTLSLFVLPLAATASASGLFFPSVYRDTAWVVPQSRGQDLVTLLVVVPALASAMRAAARGSARATLVWLGLLGYLFYTYAGAAFAYALNPLFLVYVAIFSLSFFALASAALGLDVQALRDRFDGGEPRRGAIGFLLLIALMLSVLWLGQLVPFFTHGELPEGVRLAGNGMIFVYVLDLGLVVPLAVLSAVGLLRRLAWAWVLAAFVLIKAATMGLALLAMTWFSIQAGSKADPGMVAAWLLIAGGGLAMSLSFFRHCREAS